MSMSYSEAIEYLEELQCHSFCESECDALEMAIEALKRVEWEDTLWHDAKKDPPKTPGIYYGKKDDTNSMYAVNYRDGVWTLDSYPDQKMDILQWAEYAAFKRGEDEKSIIEKHTKIFLDFDELSKVLDRNVLFFDFNSGETKSVVIHFFANNGIIYSAKNMSRKFISKNGYGESWAILNILNVSNQDNIDLEGTGCEFCKRFDFRTARTETDKYGARILLAGGVSTFPKEKCFKFCPECGRKLP